MATSIWKQERPYGEAADYVVAIAACVATGFAGWFVLPLIGIEGLVRFAVALLEPPLVALIALWIMRRVKSSAVQ